MVCSVFNSVVELQSGLEGKPLDLFQTLKDFLNVTYSD